MAHDAVEALAREVAAVLEAGLDGEEAVEAMRGPMETFLARADEAVAERERSSLDGDAVGHLLHVDPEERFHILSVVFPPGTSSGVHEHGCWGVIGYVQGLDEEARYRRVDAGSGPEGCVLEKVDEALHRPGEVSRLLPPAEAFHRVRNPGDVDGVSVHVLCRAPETHPHRYWDRDTQRLLPFPFETSDEGLVRAEVRFEA